MAYHDEMMEEYNKKKAEKMTGELCEICDTPLYSDPGPHELGIYLHAKKYACEEGSWQYESNYPDWALPPPDVNVSGVIVEEEGILEESGVVELKESSCLSDNPMAMAISEPVCTLPSRPLWVMPG